MNNSSINHSFQVNIRVMLLSVVHVEWVDTQQIVKFLAIQPIKYCFWHTENLLHQSTLQLMLFMPYSYHCTSDNHQLQAMWADFCACLASYPRPTQLSVASCTVKWERAWCLLSREWRRDRKGGRKGLIVRGHTGPKTANRAKVSGNLPHVSS